MSSRLFKYKLQSLYVFCQLVMGDRFGNTIAYPNANADVLEELFLKLCSDHIPPQSRGRILKLTRIDQFKLMEVCTNLKWSLDSLHSRARPVSCTV